MKVENPKIIKIEEVDNSIQKRLDEKLFRFECDIVNENLRIGLKEINKYSPYYYEKYFSKEDLDTINDLFKSLKDVDAVKKRLIKCFNKMAVLKNAKDGENLYIFFNIPSFDEMVEVNFELERKTIQDKDAGLMYLFEIQKKNIAIINKIREQCLKNQKDPVSKQILQLLNN